MSRPSPAHRRWMTFALACTALGIVAWSLTVGRAQVVGPATPQTAPVDVTRQLDPADRDESSAVDPVIANDATTDPAAPTAGIVQLIVPQATTPNYLGFSVRQVSTGRVLVHEVLADGAAAAAGIQPGDQVVGMADLPVSSAAQLHDRLGDIEPKDAIPFSFQRGTDVIDVVLKMSDQPPTAATQADAVPSSLVLGMTLEHVGSTVVVREVAPKSAAQMAGIVPGDIVVAVGNFAPLPLEPFLTGVTDMVHTAAPGDAVQVVVMRDGQQVAFNVAVAPPQTPAAPSGATMAAGGAVITQQPVAPLILGLVLAEPEPNVVVVQEVMPNSPAAIAALQPGDVILAIEEQPCRSIAQFSAYVELQRVGSQMSLQMARQDSPFLATVHVLPRLADIAALAEQRAGLIAAEHLGTMRAEVVELQRVIVDMRQQRAAQR